MEKLRLRVHIPFLLAVILLAYVGYQAHQSLVGSARFSYQAVRSNQFASVIRSLYNNLESATTSQQAFLLTSDERYADLTRKDLKRLIVDLKRMESFKDVAVKPASMSLLRSMCEERIEMIENALITIQASPSQRALEAMRSGRGAQKSEEIHEQIESILNEISQTESRSSTGLIRENKMAVLWMTIGGILGLGALIFSLYLVHRELQRRIRMEARLLASQQSAELASQHKSRVLATMSHEIRTPLNGVVGMVHLLSSTELSTQQRGYTEVIKSSAQDVIGIINNILDLSKVEAGKLDLEILPFDLKRMLSEVCDLFTWTALQKDLRIYYTIKNGTGLALRGDRLRIKQILTNLIGNAVKFTDKGEVHVDVQESNAQSEDAKVQLTFSVVDTGVGMDETALKTLFNPYQQAESSTARKYGGTGLGLSISRNLIRLMGGDIVVRSQKGQGSTFEFHITLEKDTEAQPQIRPENVIPMIRRQGKILVVEDNPVNQEVLLLTLQKLGISVKIAAHGRQALEILGSEHFDLIFMDTNMPEMDGLECTRRIRSLTQKQTKAIPIVAMTGETGEEHRNACMEAGMNGFLEKPVEPRALEQALNRFLAVVPQNIRTKMPIVDFPRLEEVKKLSAHSGGKLLPKLIDYFFASSAQQMAQIRANLKSGNLTNLFSEAHAFRSSCVELGLARTAEVCRDIERAAKANDRARVEMLTPELEMSLLEVYDFLNGLKTELLGESSQAA